MQEGAGGRQEKKSALQAIMEAEQARKQQDAAGPATQHKQREVTSSPSALLRPRGAQRACQPIPPLLLTPQRPWVARGIVVKVMSKALEPMGYYKKKAAVTSVSKDGWVTGPGRRSLPAPLVLTPLGPCFACRYVAEVEVLDSGDVLRVDQRELETVIPQVGSAVLVLGGKNRGASGTLLELDTGRFQALVGVGASKEWLDYEAFSKVSSLGSA